MQRITHSCTLEDVDALAAESKGLGVAEPPGIGVVVE